MEGESEGGACDDLVDTYGEGHLGLRWWMATLLPVNQEQTRNRSCRIWGHGIKVVYFGKGSEDLISSHGLPQLTGRVSKRSNTIFGIFKTS